MQKRGKELKKNAGTASTHHAACSRLYISDHAARRRDRTLLQLNAPVSSEPARRLAPHFSRSLLQALLHRYLFLTSSLASSASTKRLSCSFSASANPCGPRESHEYVLYVGYSSPPTADAARGLDISLYARCIEYQLHSHREFIYIHPMFALIRVSYDTRRDSMFRRMYIYGRT